MIKGNIKEASFAFSNPHFRFAYTQTDLQGMPKPDVFAVPPSEKWTKKKKAKGKRKVG